MCCAVQSVAAVTPPVQPRRSRLGAGRCGQQGGGAAQSWLPSPSSPAPPHVPLPPARRRQGKWPWITFLSDTFLSLPWSLLFLVNRLLDELQTMLCTTTFVPSSRVLGIVFLTFVICWAPFFIINLVVGTCGQPCDPPAFLGEMALWLGKLNCSI